MPGAFVVKREVGEARKPGSVPAICYLFAGDVHSSRPDVTVRLKRPTREQDGPPSPHLALHPMGYTWPTLSPEPPVVSYTTVSTLPETDASPSFPSPVSLKQRVGLNSSRKRPTSFEVGLLTVCFLLCFPPRRRDRELPGIVPYGARTFLRRTNRRRASGPLQPEGSLIRLWA